MLLDESTKIIYVTCMLLENQLMMEKMNMIIWEITTTLLRSS